jgi:hypothetical protein
MMMSSDDDDDDDDDEYDYVKPVWYVSNHFSSTSHCQTDAALSSCRPLHLHPCP